MELAPHQQRVVTERADLNLKIEALGRFFATGVFIALVEAEQSRLRRQLGVMQEYSDILSERIAAF